MKDFKSTCSWTGTFYDPLGKLIVTMDVKKTMCQLIRNKERVYNQELIYARVIGLLASSRDINFDDVFACELAAYPPSMFNPDREIKISKLQFTLKQKLQVTVSERRAGALG